MSSVTDLTPRHFFYDLEVDSVPRKQGEPLQCIRQIAVYDPTRPKGERYFVANIKPHKLLRRTEVNTNYNPQGHQVQQFKWKNVFADLTRWVNSTLDGNRKAVFIAHNNYKHDWPILERECARIQEAVPKFWSPFCTAYLAGILYGRGGNSLSMLCGKLGVAKLPAHDAYNDVKMLKNVFKKMVGAANLKKVLQAMLTPPRQGPVKKVAAVIQKYLVPNPVVYDFEATGLIKKDQPGPRVVEIGAFLPHSKEEWQTFVDPGMKIPEESIAIHHITDDMVKGAPGFKAAWLQLEEKIDRETANSANKITILMGHNIWGYDEKVRKLECERTNLPVRNFKSFDTYALCRSLFKGLPRISQKLQTWVERLNIPIKEGEAHRAGADSRVNYEFFLRLVKGVPPKMINKSLMSAHPVKSLACAILEHGNFKPSSWIPKEEEDAPVKRKDDKPETNNRPLKKTKVKENVKSDFSAYAPVKKKKKKKEKVTQNVKEDVNVYAPVKKKKKKKEKVKQNVKEDVNAYAPAKNQEKKGRISDYFSKEANTNYNPKNVIVINDEDNSWNSNLPPRKAHKRVREDSTTPVVRDSKREREDSKDEVKMFFSSK